MKKCLLLTAVVFLGTFTAAIAQVPSYVPADGLVGWWPFNGNANDESGNGNDGVVNGASLIEDRNGNSNTAFLFGGGSVDIPMTLQLFSLPEKGFSCWFRATNGQTGGRIYETTFQNSGIGFYNGSTFDTWYAYSQHCCNIVGIDGGAISIWHHLVVNSNDFSGLTQVFLDGVLIASSDGYPAGNGCFSNTNWQWEGQFMRFGIGASGESFYGEIDDIGIWNRALTEQEIQSLYIGCNVAPTTIAGDLSPATLTSSSYACNNNPGSTYQWTVTNGVITAGQGTSNVTVLWGEEGTGTLSVVETNAEGCSGATSAIDVTVVCATTATAIDGPLGPNALTSTTYTCNGVAGSSYQWTISNGVITSGQGTNSVTVLWAGTGLGTISVQETTNANCAGDVISLDVVVIPTSVEEQQDLSIALFPNPASNEVTLTASEGLRGKTYILFSPAGQVVVTGTLSSRTTINLQGIATGIYTISVEGIVRKTLTVVSN